ncbi:MAG: cellulase family glycosylhydrolase [Prevotellaceae bacterium]|jgi:hypothetical protein|nr:cellulase family glycosylhydrolase [Prevotellaceae bacterium]
MISTPFFCKRTVFTCLFLFSAFSFVWATDLLPDGIIPSNMGVQLKTHSEGPDHLNRVRDLGMKWVRRGFIWTSIEKQKGVYDFTSYDKFVNNCHDRGLSIIGCMAFSNEALYSHAKDEPGRTAYANWAAALAKRYKDYNIIWEIWNEPNTMTFWGKHGGVGNSLQYAQEYTALVNVVVPAMKAANPDCIILAGSVSNLWSESYKWMSYCFSNAGMLDIDWDAWSVHPYGLPTPEDYIEGYAISRQKMTDAGGDTHNRPWINSERGFSINANTGENEEIQAWHAIRQYFVDLLENVPLTIWYEWLSGGTETFSLYRSGEPLPAMKACEVMIRELSGYRLDQRIPAQRARDFVLRFINDNNDVKLVVWAAPEPMQRSTTIIPHSININVGEYENTLDTTSIYGEKGTITVSGGIITPYLSGAPTYISLKKTTNVPSVDTKNMIIPSGKGFFAYADKTSTLTVYRINGTVFMQQKIDAGTTYIPVPAGFYIVNFTNNSYKLVVGSKE